MRTFLVIVASLTVLAMASAASCHGGNGESDTALILAFEAVAEISSWRIEIGNSQQNQIDMTCRSSSQPPRGVAIGLYLVIPDVKCLQVRIRFGADVGKSRK